MLVATVMQDSPALPDTEEGYLAVPGRFNFLIHHFLFDFSLSGERVEKAGVGRG